MTMLDRESRDLAATLRGLYPGRVVAASTDRPAGAVRVASGADPAALRAALGDSPTAVALGRTVLGLGIDFASAQSAAHGVVSPSEPATGRMSGKVAVITGAAQGFGLGLAECLLARGACVVMADLNIELAQGNAERLQGTYPGRVIALEVNVTDESSWESFVNQLTARAGGLDLLISNAGVLRADSVLTQSVEDFDLVTSVNYRGYFLGVKHLAPLLVQQHAADPSRWYDIIEINSKSGLEGSKRNFAYAGSKFGGIGLTQSFALELVQDGIKVNAVCPGNFLDGPLWTDPERGLFVQYLRAGKVPGATTVEEVRRFYEAKVPMKRGCLPEDLARAVDYLVEQTYETGQAMPVTGGQVMLN